MSLVLYVYNNLIIINLSDIFILWSCKSKLAKLSLKLLIIYFKNKMTKRNKIRVNNIKTFISKRK